jgi:hypothetical protein
MNTIKLFEEVLKESIGDGGKFSEEDFLDDQGYYKELPGLCMICNRYNGPIVDELEGYPMCQSCSDRIRKKEKEGTLYSE